MECAYIVELLKRPRQLFTYICYIYVRYSSKFSRSNNFVIFVKWNLITKFLSTKIFTPMGVSIGAVMNHEKCCLQEAVQAESRKF